jgi:mono/diheme cytochrome c family protein
MQLKRLIWILFPAVMITLALSAQNKGDVAKGKALYSRCTVCHGDSGEGKEAMGKVFGVTMPHLGSKEIQSLDDAALKKIIVEGKGKMKPVSLSSQEIADVIAYVRTLKNKTNSPK